ncbi:MAG: alpha-mannosidase, partial [Armatimonadetes bacterium]|nr:alpha-mannosidase [Armatimonadota bacterium]
MADIYSERVPIKPIRFRASDEKPKSVGRVVKPGFAYTDKAASSFFSATVTVPAEWAGGRVGLHIVITGGEPLLFVDGKPYQALDYNHADVLLYDCATGGETHDLLIEVYARTVGVDISLKSADLVLTDRDATRTGYDRAITAQLGRLTDDGAEIPPLPPVRVVCVGHSHLDLAYLWALPNTRKKVGRTWATALRLMDEYPAFRFTQSQPFLYDVCKSDYPDLWERVKARVAEGRWETTGAMWVEADVQIPSGESLVRQLLHGQAFYKREFGVASNIAWLPDTFGFGASLPQLLRSADVPYLLTAKLSWNDTNAFPHDTFRWRGVDGSEVIAHFLTAPDYHPQLGRTVATYRSTTGVEQVRGAVERYRHAGVHGEILYCVGYGDGGGGATREMAEMVARFGCGIAGVPVCDWGRADEFFDRLGANADNLPAWRGELYLENHRGALTSQGWLKRANRVCETLLRNAEIFACVAEIEAGVPYPAEELGAVWRVLLTNQFHDILAGTVIAEAVEDARADFARVAEIGNRVLTDALAAIAARIVVREDTFVVANPSDILRPSDVVRVTVPATVVKALEFGDDTGAILPSQFVSVDKKGNRDYLVLLTNVGAMGYQTIGAFKASGAAEETTVTAEVAGDGAVLENEFARVTVNDHGEVVSFVHKIGDGDDDDPDAVREREVIAHGGRGNVLTVYADAPASYDAWNIDAAALDSRTDMAGTATVESFAVTENGAVRAGIRVIRTFRASTVTQNLFLFAHSPRDEVQTVVDWHEKQTLLCVHFPVAVHANFATYEIA